MASNLKQTFRNTTKVVRAILIRNPKARNTDSVLFLECLKDIQPSVLDMTVREYLEKLPYLPVPAFESMRRARQKIQADDPDLSADAPVLEARDLLEKQYSDLMVK